MKKLSSVLSFFVFVLFALPLFAQITYVKGDKIEAFWQGSWSKANILGPSSKTGYYRVHFNGYWASREELLPLDKIRPISQHTQPDLNALKKGDAVEVLEGDHWKPATFVEAQGKKALVRYADGEAHQEKLVPIGHLAQVPSSTPAPK